VKIQLLIVTDWNQKLRLTGRLRHSTCSASGQWQLQTWAATSPLRSATYYIIKHAGANQIATRLLRHCSGSARCCSQPAVIGLLPTVAPTDLRSRQQKSGPSCTHFGKHHYFRRPL